MIYEPREDSFLLQKHVEKFARAHGRVLDIGTGSGIQALIALKKTKNVLATDIDEEAVKAAKSKGINAIKSDLFENVRGRFDLIIFNPPYLPEDEREDQESKLQTTGGKKGYETIAKFLAQARNHLAEKGEILLVFSSLTGDVEAVIKKHNFKYSKLEEKKLFFETIYACILEK